MLISMYIFLGEMSIQIFYPSFFSFNVTAN